MVTGFAAGGAVCARRGVRQTPQAKLPPTSTSFAINRVLLANPLLRQIIKFLHLCSGSASWKQVRLGSGFCLVARQENSCRRSRRHLQISWREHLPDRKSTRLNSSHLGISYAVFC